MVGTQRQSLSPVTRGTLECELQVRPMEVMQKG